MCLLKLSDKVVLSIRKTHDTILFLWYEEPGKLHLASKQEGGRIVIHLRVRGKLTGSTNIKLVLDLQDQVVNRILRRLGR